MTHIRSALRAALFLVASVGNVHATDRIFNDITADSPSKTYRVEARSPDNAHETGHRAFQASFVYTCRDMTTNQVLWTRAQAMGKPRRLGKGSTATYSYPEEASPVAILASDAGWTVIRTGWDELIAVDPTGHDRCCVGLLTEGFTDEENAAYVHNTTAGPMWSGYSLWYFLDAGDQHLFILRPWWGRRLVLNLERGKLRDETPDIARDAAAFERRYVMDELTKGVATRKQREKDGRYEAVRPVLKASYLAGRLPVPEAAPLLEQLQAASYIGSSTSGGLGSGEQFEGEVNPHSYKTFTLRQVVQLSLRRLGERPRPFAANQLIVEYEDFDKVHPYTPKAAIAPRAMNAGNVKAGMKAEQVLDLLGGPDFVGYDTWEYDMDADPPFSLILRWDARSVIDAEKKTPAVWEEGFARDAQIVR